MFNKENAHRQLLSVLAAIFLSSAVAGNAIAETPLQGAWLLTEAQYPDGKVNSDPMPGLIMFTATHYSMMFATGDEPRARMEEEEPSDAEIVQAYQTFIAHSGRYDVAAN